MMRIQGPALLAAVLALASTVTSTSYAQDSGSSIGVDEVTLKNGGSVRGTIVSVEPGTKVTIVEVGAKEPRTIPWAEVADVEKGKYAASAPGSAGPGYPTPPPAHTAPARDASGPAPDRPGVVRLHIDSPEPVRIVARSVVGQGQIGAYGFIALANEFVCASPCDQVIDVRSGAEYIVQGEMPAASFRLDGKSGDVTARVTPGNRGLRVGGFVALGLGGAAMLTGATFLVVGAVSSSGGQSDEGRTTAGGIALGAGAAVLVGGIIMVVAGRTKVAVDQTSALADAARRPRYWLGEF